MLFSHQSEVNSLAAFEMLDPPGHGREVPHRAAWW